MVGDYIMLFVGVECSFVIVLCSGCIDVGMIIDLMVLCFVYSGEVCVLFDLCMLENMCVVLGGLYLVVCLYL